MNPNGDGDDVRHDLERYHVRPGVLHWRLRHAGRCGEEIGLNQTENAMKVVSVNLPATGGGSFVDDAGQVWTMAGDFAAFLRGRCELAATSSNETEAWPVRAIGQVTFPVTI